MPKKKQTPATAEQTLMPASDSSHILSFPYNIDWATQELQKAVAEHNASGIAIGLLCKVIKENEDHGGYLKALEKVNYSARSASRYVRRAEFVMAHQAQFKSANLADLTGSKIDTLLKLPAETFSEYVGDDGTINGLSIDDIENMSAKQLRIELGPIFAASGAAEGEIQELESMLSMRDTQLEKLQAEKANLQEQLQRKERLTPLPEFVEYAQTASTLWADKGMDVANRFEEMVGRCANPEAFGFDASDPNSTDHYAMASSVIMYNLLALHAKLGGVISELMPLVNESVRDQAGETVLLAPEQIASILSRRALMMAEHNGDAMTIENTVADKVKKRGRRRTKPSAAKKA